MNTIITGQCKIDFEKWVVENYNYDLNETYFKDGILYFNQRSFYTLPLDFQWGVYESYFEQKSIYMCTTLYFFDKDSPHTYSFDIFYDDGQSIYSSEYSANKNREL